MRCVLIGNKEVSHVFMWLPNPIEPTKLWLTIIIWEWNHVILLNRAHGVVCLHVLSTNTFPDSVCGWCITLTFIVGHFLSTNTFLLLLKCSRKLSHLFFNRVTLNCCEDLLYVLVDPTCLGSVDHHSLVTFDHQIPQHSNVHFQHENSHYIEGYNTYIIGEFL